AMFTVVLPVKAPAGVTVQAEKAAGVQGAEVLAELSSQFAKEKPVHSTGAHGASVLVVEDNTDMRDYLTGLLSAYRVETASNGRDGLDKALELIPDLIISDVMMPHMSGDEMARVLLSQPQTRHIPLLMLTAKMDDPLKLDMLKEGVRDYIAKPFAAEELK